MKSSTLHRSNLSKERIAVLEELLSARKNPSAKRVVESQPDAEKDRELDILWQQGLKVNQKDERSPGVYLAIGFIAGIFCMFLMTAILNIGNSSNGLADLNLWKKDAIKPASVTVLSAEPGSTPRTEKYIIRNGDTLDKISQRFYGIYDLEKIKQIQDINNIRNPKMIRIGQEIIIPLTD